MQWSFLESFTQDSPYFKKKSVTTPKQQTVCNAGQKYDTNSKKCIPCEDGKYQDKTKHTLTTCKPHENITCQVDEVMNQSVYNEKRKNKTTPIKYKEVCDDDQIYRRLQSLKDGLDNKDKMNINQDDIINMLTFEKINYFRSSQNVVPYDEGILKTNVVFDEIPTYTLSTTVETPATVDEAPATTQTKPTKTVIIGKTENVENGYNCKFSRS